MLQLLTAALMGLALSAAQTSTTGQFLALGENEKAAGVLEANGVERSGDKVRATVTVIFAKSTDASGLRITSLVVELDCAKQTFSVKGSAAVSDDMKVSDAADLDIPPAPAQNGTPFGRAYANLCKGETLPVAGTDLGQIARGYWSRQGGSPRPL